MSSGAEWFTLFYILIGTLVIDLLLLLVAVLWVGRRILLTIVLLAYLALNVVVPVLLVLRFTGSEWGWGIALMVLVKAMEFGGFKIGSLFADLWWEQPRPVG